MGLTDQDVQAIKLVSKDESLEAKLLASPETQADLVKLMRRVTDRLEAELQHTQEANKLHEAQRDECPPSYRHWVNKYFEALSQRQK